MGWMLDGKAEKLNFNADSRYQSNIAISRRQESINTQFFASVNGHSLIK
jgi:hypothetical protein